MSWFERFNEFRLENITALWILFAVIIVVVVIVIPRIKEAHESRAPKGKEDNRFRKLMNAPKGPTEKELREKQRERERNTEYYQQLRMALRQNRESFVQGIFKAVEYFARQGKSRMYIIYYYDGQSVLYAYEGSDKQWHSKKTRQRISSYSNLGCEKALRELPTHHRAGFWDEILKNRLTQKRVSEEGLTCEFYQKDYTYLDDNDNRCSDTRYFAIVRW